MLAAMLEPVGFGYCNCESNIQEKETASEAVNEFDKMINI